MKLAKLKRRWHTQRKMQSAIAGMGRTIDIATPSIGDIPPMQFSVLTAWRGPLWIELSDDMLTWITKAVKYQVESGVVRSKRARKTGDDDGEDDDDIEPDEDAQSSASSNEIIVDPSVADVVEAQVPPMPKRSPNAVRTAPPQSVSTETEQSVKRSKISDFFTRKSTTD